MDVSCENCGAHYELDTSRFKGSSLRVQCSSCGHVFRVQKTLTESPSPSLPMLSPLPDNTQKWVIRYKDGALSIVPDKATLQRWIVERRVSPEDQVSQDEIHWRAFGEIEEFQPFFLVVAQSTATHLGVHQTGVFAAPILTPGALALTPSGNIQNFATIGLTPAVPTTTPAVPTTTPAVPTTTHATKPHAHANAHTNAAHANAHTNAAHANAHTNAAHANAHTHAAPPSSHFTNTPAPSHTLAAPAPTPTPTPTPQSAPSRSLGPALALDSSPKATLEFGLAQALEGLKSSNSALLAAAEAALATSEQTIASTEAVSEADAAFAPPSELTTTTQNQEHTEISLEAATNELANAVASVSLRTSSLDDENDPLAFPKETFLEPLPTATKPHRPTNAPIPPTSATTKPTPPTSPASKPPTNEWFMGSSDALDLAAEPAFQDGDSLAESPDSKNRDFSFDAEHAVSEEELAFQPKKLGWFGRFVILLFLLAALGGGLYLLQPTWSEPLWIRARLLEARAASQSLLLEAHNQQYALHEAAWQRATEQLKQVETIEGGRAFLGLTLARAQQQLTRIEALHLALLLNQQQQERTRQQLKTIRRTLATLPPQTPQRAAFEKKLQTLQNTASQDLDRLQQEEKAHNRQIDPLVKAAQEQLKIAESIDRFDIRTRLTKAHLYALSPGAAQDAPKIFEQLSKQTLSPEQRSTLFLIRGTLALRENKTDTASDDLDLVCRERPNWVWPILARAALWAVQQKPSQSIQEFTRALELAKQQPLAQQWLTWLQTPRPDLTPPQAPAPSKTTLSPNATTPPTAPNGELDKQPLAALVRNAERLRQREKCGAALRYYYAALKKKRSGTIFAGLGWCTLEANQLTKAQSYFKTALKLDSNNALALFGLGLTFRRRGKKVLAKQTFETYLSRFPDSTDAREVKLILQGL